MMYTLLFIWCICYKSAVSDEEIILGIDPSRITSIKGVTLDDSRKQSYRRGYVNVRLIEVKDDTLGITSEASGNAILRLSYTKPIYKGDIVYGKVRKVEGRLFTLKSISVIEEKSKNTVLDSIYNLRAAFLSDAKSHINTLSKYVKHKNNDIAINSRRLSLMLLFSYKESSKFDFLDNAREVGLSHVFALSGMHLNVISNCLLFLSSFFFPVSFRRKAVFPILSLYAFLASTSPSLIRAYFYILVITFMPFTKDYALFFALFLQTLFAKGSVNSVAFVLSYTSTVSLFYLRKFIKVILTPMLSKDVALYLSSGIAAFILSSPFCIQNFGFFSPYGIVLSPLAVIFVFVNMIGGFISLIFPGSVIGGFFMDIPYVILDKVTSFFARYPIKFSWIGYFVMVGLLICVVLVKMIKIHLSSKKLGEGSENSKIEVLL